MKKLLRVDRGPASMKAPLIVIGCVALFCAACVLGGFLLDSSSTGTPQSSAPTDDQLAAIDIARGEILSSSIVLARSEIQSARRINGRRYAVNFRATYRDMMGGIQNGALTCIVDLENGKASIERP